MSSSSEQPATQAPTMPGPDAPPADQPRHRLTIGHLMLWMVGIAVCLATYKLMIDAAQLNARLYIGSEQEQQRALEVTGLTVLLLILSPIFGSGFAGLTLAVSRLVWRAPRFPNQAGHWLLIRSGVIQLVISVATVTMVIIDRFTPMQADAVLDGTFFVFIGLVAALFVVSAIAFFRIREMPRWKFCFLTWSFGYAAILIGFIGAPLDQFNTAAFDNVANVAIQIVIAIFGLIGIIGFIALAIARIAVINAVFRDLYHSPARDFFHWTGVTVDGLGFLLVAAFWVYGIIRQ